MSRPEVLDVVTVDVAEAELTAVREMLDQLRDDVRVEEHAASAAEGEAAMSRRSTLAAVAPGSSAVGPEIEAIAVSRRIVEQMTAARREELRAAEQEVYLEAQAQVLEASRRAAELNAASRRDAAELLRDRLDTPPHWTEPREDPARGETVDLSTWSPALPDPPRWTKPLPALQHWAEPAPTGPPVAAAVSAVADRDEVAAAHAQFWREEAQATSVRTLGVSPVEVLLPTAALLILLLAVLLLIG